MGKLTVCGKDYELKKITFNSMCELEERYDLDLSKLGNKGISTIRSLFAFVANVSLIEAGEIIEEHLLNGGELSDFNVLADMLLDSSFFYQKSE